MIYTDGIHILSDTSLDELREFAVKIGLRKCWLHRKTRFIHYDKPKGMSLAKLIDNGAVFKTSRQLVYLYYQGEISKC